ncbi:MAG: response regulator [Anaerolineales bacterium]|nr:response regulator [Anaerolineales bacterium]
MDQEVILIADDNEVLRTALDEMLSMAGFVVLTAANGREAISRMEYITPDIIVSDITMPEMDGYAFFEAVRARPEWLSIPFIFLTARGTKREIITGKDLGAEDYLVKPIHRDELLSAVRAKLNRSNQLRIIRLREAYESSLMMLANAIEVRDSYTRGHVERVRDYALLMAQQMGWGTVQLNRLRFGAILHDIGKIHIRESILRKKGKLSEQEWQLIREHPITGAEMVKDIPYLQDALPIIIHHHEYWDGSGYPHGLAGQDIPPTARIVVVADAFDAMTTDRPYQPSKTLAEALKEIVAYAGIKYDPEVVEALQLTWDTGQLKVISER